MYPCEGFWTTDGHAVRATFARVSLTPVSFDKVLPRLKLRRCRNPSQSREALFSEKCERLIDLHLKVIEHIKTYLGITSRFVLLSELGLETKEPALSVAVSRKLGASHFLAQSSAKKYLDREAFDKAGIELQFFNPRPPVYPQLWGPFISNLSTLDMLFNCGPIASEIIRRM